MARIAEPELLSSMRILIGGQVVCLFLGISFPLKLKYGHSWLGQERTPSLGLHPMR